MYYKIVRRDLISEVRKCDLCPNKLTSFKAYVLQHDVTGEIKFAGPKCALKNISKGESLDDCPDFTNFTVNLQTHDGGGHGNASSKDVVDDAKQRAIEYLMLREEILSEEFKCTYHVLEMLYQKHKNEGLSPEDVKHINNIEAKAPQDLKLSHLKKIYNYLFWINVAISRTQENKANFLIDVRKSIIKFKKMTENQKKAINKWLERIDGVPQLK
jgi:hypothetical protein